MSPFANRAGAREGAGPKLWEPPACPMPCWQKLAGWLTRKKNQLAAGCRTPKGQAREREGEKLVGNVLPAISEPGVGGELPVSTWEGGEKRRTHRPPSLGGKCPAILRASFGAALRIQAYLLVCTYIHSTDRPGPQNLESKKVNNTADLITWAALHLNGFGAATSSATAAGPRPFFARFSHPAWHGTGSHGMGWDGTRYGPIQAHAAVGSKS